MKINGLPDPVIQYSGGFFFQTMTKYWKFSIKQKKTQKIKHMSEMGLRTIQKF